MATSVTYKRFNGTTWEELYFPYSHSHSWGSITSKPSWIGSSKPSYTASEITTTAGITVQAALNNFASTASLKSETISALSISGKTITYTKADGTKGTLTTQDTNTTYTLSSFGITATADEINYIDGVTSNIQTQLNGKANASHTHNYLPLAGGNITGHVYLTGAKESSSTGNTSQIIFGTSSNNHLALSSNNNALVINPTSSGTTNQIVLYLDKQSQFPSGITSNGTINGKTLQENGTSLSNKYQAKGNYLTEHQSLANYSTLANTIKALSISGKTITYTKGDGTTGTLTTQDTNTTYSAATTSANGLMSSSDKAKLDGITIDSSATFSSATAHNVPTKTAIASYLSSNYLSVGDVSFSQTLTSGTAIGTITINGTAKTIYAPSSSGGSSSGGGLTEGGQLDVATIEDFYSKYINDLSGNYVTTAKVVECVKAYNNGDLGGGSSSGGGYEDSPTFSTVTCDNLTVTTSGGASIHRIYVGGSGSFAGSCNFTGGIYINGTHIDTYIRNLVG